LLKISTQYSLLKRDPRVSVLLSNVAENTSYRVKQNTPTVIFKLSLHRF